MILDLSDIICYFFIMNVTNNFPNTLPIFPLSNFIFFPNTPAPLNIFEPRYIQMIDQSIKTNRMIGMVQPKGVVNAKIPVSYTHLRAHET